MTLEKLIEKKAFRLQGYGHRPSAPMAIKVDDLLAWAIEQMEQGNLLPGATKENGDES